MSKLIHSLFPVTLLMAALSLPAMTVAQTDPGSLDELLGADFEPLQNQPAQQVPELNAPLIMGPQVQRPQDVLPQMESVLEVPRVTIDERAPGELVLPDLTIPTPENTAIDSRMNRRSLKPKFEVRPPDPIELRPFDDDDAAQIGEQIPAQPRSTFVQPRMQTPQVLNYGSRAYSSRSRLLSVPIQVEFFSTSRSFGYQPYGAYGPGYRSNYGSGYRSSYGSGFRSGYGSYGRPPAGYRPYGGGDPRYCPYGR